MDDADRRRCEVEGLDPRLNVVRQDRGQAAPSQRGVGVAAQHRLHMRDRAGAADLHLSPPVGVVGEGDLSGFRVDVLAGEHRRRGLVEHRRASTLRPNDFACSWPHSTTWHAIHRFPVPYRADRSPLPLLPAVLDSGAAIAPHCEPPPISLNRCATISFATAAVCAWASSGHIPAMLSRLSRLSGLAGVSAPRPARTPRRKTPERHTCAGPPPDQHPGCIVCGKPMMCDQGNNVWVAANGGVTA